MTKFEEKLEILPIKIIQHPVGDTKYYAAVHVKTLIAQADEEIADLKSQLQQQALPVVPERVGEFITKIKKADNSLTFAFNSKFNECPAEYWNEAIVWRLNNPDEFARAWLDGYTVEKPQLFYLKNKITGMYLSSDGKDLYEHHKNHGFKFTQEDINSLDTGSYELVPVEDEK